MPPTPPSTPAASSPPPTSAPVTTFLRPPVSSSTASPTAERRAEAPPASASASFSPSSPSPRMVSPARSSVPATLDRWFTDASTASACLVPSLRACASAAAASCEARARASRRVNSPTSNRSRSRCSMESVAASAGPTLGGRRCGAGLNVTRAAKGEMRNTSRRIAGSSAFAFAGFCAADRASALPPALRPETTPEPEIGDEMLSLGGAASALANATNRHIALSCTRRCTPAGVHATHAAGNRVSTAAESSVFVFREGVSATRESVSGFCATEVSVARSRGPRSGSCHTTTGNAAPGCGSSTCSAATFSSSAPDPPATPRPEARRASTPSRLTNAISRAPSTTLSESAGSESSSADSGTSGFPSSRNLSFGEVRVNGPPPAVHASAPERSRKTTRFSASAAGAKESARRPFSKRVRTATRLVAVPGARNNAAGSSSVEVPSANASRTPRDPLATAAGTASTARDAPPSARAFDSGQSPTHTSTNAGTEDASSDPASAIPVASSSS